MCTCVHDHNDNAIYEAVYMDKHISNKLFFLMSTYMFVCMFIYGAFACLCVSIWECVCESVCEPPLSDVAACCVYSFMCNECL